MLTDQERFMKEAIRQAKKARALAVADADGDVLAGDGDAAAVEETVDGDTVPLHLLHQLPQILF